MNCYKPCFLAIAFLLTLQPCLAAVDGESIATNADGVTVELQVYKKWIGASGDEANVEIHLDCHDDVDFEPRFINRDRSDGWQIGQVPANGLFCSVQEIESDTFIADVSDCKDLLVLAGQVVECTMVNTKVVKRIDMLNRYGLFMMIFVMLGAGLAAVKRLGPL